MLAAPEFHTTNLVDVTSDARTGTPSRPVNENVPYKAFVHVNLFGGCDTLNMLMPHVSLSVCDLQLTCVSLISHIIFCHSLMDARHYMMSILITAEQTP